MGKLTDILYITLNVTSFSFSSQFGGKKKKKEQTKVKNFSHTIFFPLPFTTVIMENHIFFSLFLSHFSISPFSTQPNIAIVIEIILQILELIEAIDQNDKIKIRDLMKVIYWVPMVGCMFKHMVGNPNSKKYEMHLKVLKRFWRETRIWQSWEIVCIGSQSIPN